MSAMRLKLRVTRVVAPGELNRQMRPRFTNLMNAMGRRAQRLVPKRSWALHDTIRTDVTERGTQLIGTLTAGGGPRRVGYAVLVERGTSRMSAQPYLRPALLQTTGRDLNAGGGLDPDHGTALLTRKLNRMNRARDRAADKATKATEDGGL